MKCWESASRVAAASVTSLVSVGLQRRISPPTLLLRVVSSQGQFTQREFLVLRVCAIGSVNKSSANEQANAQTCLVFTLLAHCHPHSFAVPPGSTEDCCSVSSSLVQTFKVMRPSLMCSLRPCRPSPDHQPDHWPDSSLAAFVFTQHPSGFGSVRRSSQTGNPDHLVLFSCGASSSFCLPLAPAPPPFSSPFHRPTNKYTFSPLRGIVRVFRSLLEEHSRGSLGEQERLRAVMSISPFGTTGLRDVSVTLPSVLLQKLFGQLVSLQRQVSLLSPASGG